MTARAASSRLSRLKLMVWLMAGFGLALIVVANAHMLYVAVSSQPDCVAHLRQGERRGGHDTFSAADSACTPATTAMTMPTKAHGE